MVPSTSQVAVIVNPTNLSNPPQLALLRAAAPPLAASLFVFEAKRGDEIDSAFRAITAARVDALVFIADPLLGSEAKRIVELAARTQLPAICWSREFPDAGGLMSYGANLEVLWRRAAIINLKTARALGLTISRRHCCCGRIRSLNEPAGVPVQDDFDLPRGAACR